MSTPHPHLALRAGVGAAAASVSGSFARGLLPRSASDQAIATAASAAFRLGVGTVAVSAAEVLADIAIARRRGTTQAGRALLISSGLLGAACFAAVLTIPDDHNVALPVATARSAAYLIGTGATATAVVLGVDEITDHSVGERPLLEGVLVSAAIGSAVTAVNLWRRDRLAHKLGELDRHQVERPSGTVAALRAVGTGLAAGAGLVGLAGLEHVIAEGTAGLVAKVTGGAPTPLVGHAVALGALGAAGVYALTTVRRRIEHADDIVEPAYPAPPTSPHVTAGPASVIPFDTIGKEGRRFVTMALTPDDIEAVMGEPAVAPVRVVAGYEAAKDLRERAAKALADLEALGAFERSVIVVASPTGVGYVNYSFAEAVEYLTRGSSAIVVPQYALVPSALALNQTKAGVELQTLVLEGIRDRVSAMPEGQRPRILQFGESLGAQVALEVAARNTTDFDLLGIERGLYLGTPFRTRLWQRWVADPAEVDPVGILGSVSQADEIGTATSPQVRHVQIVHHDDPINKFSYDAVVRTPWWMGAPHSRPPGVPLETRFRPVTTFIINLIDLKNGMNSKPGEFVRRGHDYRIELCEGVQRAYGLAATPDQSARIEQALRDREREWAARRMVARRFAKARSAITTQLSAWGVDVSSLDGEALAALAAGDFSALDSRTSDADQASGSVEPPRSSASTSEAL